MLFRSYAEDELKIHALKEIIENLNEVIKEEKKSLLVDQIKNYEINEFENYMNSTDNIKLNNNFFHTFLFDFTDTKLKSISFNYFAFVYRIMIDYVATDREIMKFAKENFGKKFVKRKQTYFHIEEWIGKDVNDFLPF